MNAKINWTELGDWNAASCIAKTYIEEGQTPGQVLERNRSSACWEFGGVMYRVNEVHWPLTGEAHQTVEIDGVQYARVRTTGWLADDVAESDGWHTRLPSF